MIKHFTILILIMSSCGIVGGNIGHNEINLIDYDTNKFININSSVPLFDYIFTLKAGRNWIGMPFNISIYDANTLIRNISNCEQIGWWNPETQALETYCAFPSPPFPPGTYGGTNFNIAPLCGYEITVRVDTVYALNCLQPTQIEINYNVFDLNKYIGTNIIRVRDV